MRKVVDYTGTPGETLKASILSIYSKAVVAYIVLCIFIPWMLLENPTASYL